MKGLFALRSGKLGIKFGMTEIIKLSQHNQDNSGTIENEELKGFLKDLLELVKKVGSKTQDTTVYFIFGMPSGRLRCPGSGSFRRDYHAGSGTRQARQDLAQGAHHDPADTGQNVAG